MLTTFGQAKKQLAPFSGAFQLCDLGSAINQAVDELASSRNWQHMRKVRRFTTSGEFFALSQDCESIVRCAVNGTPVSVRGADYEFLHSGPGDLDYLPAGYAPANGLQDLGPYATMYDFEEGSSLVCFGTSAAPECDIRIRGRNADGDLISGVVPYQQWTSADDLDDPIVLTVTPLAGFTFVDRVIIPEDASAYISMYAVKDGEYSFVSRMHPGIRVPEFRRYRLPSFSDTTDASYSVLAEVRLRALPLIEDADILPFDSILPVQYMLTAMRNMATGEVKSADDYRQRALALLVNREEVQDSKQGLLVINSLFEGSLGQMSETYDNI